MADIDDIRNEISKIDDKFSKLFESRISLLDKVIDYKTINQLPIFNPAVEKEKISRSLKSINNPEVKFYYEKFLLSTMNISKMYQSNKASSLEIFLDDSHYEIILEKGAIDNITKYLDLDRKVLIISDDLIPQKYINTVKNQINDCHIFIIPHGENNKSLENYSKIMSYLIENNFSRNDAIIALGGGVVGDLAGFVSSTYKRGIDFYNIPTSLLAMVDSSIGGKTAINFDGYKNMVGSFYQPKKVIIDPNTLLTLNKRELYSGLVEAIKMGATNDKELFELIENSSNLFDDIESIIRKSLLIKKDVIVKDTYEKNIRKVLNFGHTIGHAIESISKFSLLHGECVGIGMLYFSSKSVRDRIEKVLKKYDLPISYDVSKELLVENIIKDKKMNKDSISIIKVNEIGSFIIEDVNIDEIKNYMKGD